MEIESTRDFHTRKQNRKLPNPHLYVEIANTKYSTQPFATIYRNDGRENYFSIVTIARDYIDTASSS